MFLFLQIFDGNLLLILLTPQYKIEQKDVQRGEDDDSDQNNHLANRDNEGVVHSVLIVHQDQLHYEGIGNGPPDHARQSNQYPLLVGQLNIAACRLHEEEEGIDDQKAAEQHDQKIGHCINKYLVLECEGIEREAEVDDDEDLAHVANRPEHESRRLEVWKVPCFLY